MSTARRRLDAELVRRGLAESRERARELIAAGRVSVAGLVADKPSRQVGADEPVLVAPSTEPRWASRGAHKLLSALAAFEPAGLRPPAGRRCLDAGASTGGFTDVLLARGAVAVLAVDVGYGQLIWRLRTHPAVLVLDRTNVRHLEPADLPWSPELVVADLSFISLTTVLPALARVSDPGGDMVLMVKPQFEVGRERLGSSGVVRDPQLRAEAVEAVAAAAAGLGWPARAVAASALPGPSGNVEFFLWLQRGAAGLERERIDRAVAEAPA
jgi:23S rRNA (cytidine1920-2'-O)/16S rRNA (cytidine1409-2'-O)-methyltransferase